MYIQGKKNNGMPVVPDSSNFYYAGFAPDVKRVLNETGVKVIDSAGKSEWALMYSNNYQPVVRAVPSVQVTMPDLRNMTLKDAIYELENKNLKVVVKGKGRVVAQDITPGSVIRKNLTVTLLLN
jgi:cell division protein FtsI (penicillin-binding protein 3)